VFESHFGLRENPFGSGHKSRFIYPSREHQEALAHLRYGIENLEPFVLITGEVGTGKTTALFEALAELQIRVSVALITNSALTRGELIEEICLRFGVGIAPSATKPQSMAQLEQYLLALRGRGERAILLLDEAQNFDRELLEEIRLLSNLEAGGEKLLQIIFVGQPELEAKLSLPELRQLRQRISVHYRLRQRRRGRCTPRVPVSDLRRGPCRHERHPARDQPDLCAGHARRLC
jgi:general secretion pathway protein A